MSNENIKVVVTYYKDGVVMSKEFTSFLSNKWIHYVIDYLRQNDIPYKDVLQIVRSSKY